jgi:hypothetical protein
MQKVILSRLFSYCSGFYNYRNIKEQRITENVTMVIAD